MRERFGGRELWLGVGVWLAVSVAALAQGVWPPQEARSLGMGGGIALSEGEGALLANPAGLAFQEKGQLFSGMNSVSELGLQSSYVGLTLPLPGQGGGLGLNWAQMDAGEFAGVPFHREDVQIMLAQKAGTGGLALKLHLLRFQVDTDQGRGVALDLAGLWQKGAWRLGVVGRNVLSLEEWQEAMGTSATPRLQAGVAWVQPHWTVTGEGEWSEEGGRYRGGGEYKLGQNLTLRAGWDEGRPVLGFGLAKGFLQVDYACRQTEGLGWTNWLSSVIKF